jgi:diguanylate cyclase (GGDEF)-like protein
MGIVINLTNSSAGHRNTSLLSSKPSNLVAELALYQRKAAQLKRVYELHKRLAQKLDLASMVEEFSIWLGHYVAHELVAYRHWSRGRAYMACSVHGPRRASLLDLAHGLLEQGVEMEPNGHDGGIPANGVCSFTGEIPALGVSYLINTLNGSDEFLLTIVPGLATAASLSVSRELQTGPEIFPWHEFISEVADELRSPLERALVYEDLYDQARRDALTGLVNRRVFEERLGHEIANAQRYDRPMVLLALDLDHFKAVNDTMGHAEGDTVLRRVSQALVECVRDADLLARIGGDEFLLLLPNTTQEQAYHLAQRLCQAVSALSVQAPDAPPLGVSIGLACWEPASCQTVWLEKVDQALYRAKSAGRYQVSL